MALRDSIVIDSEAHLVSLFCQEIEKRNANPRVEQHWTIYHETAGWDLLMVDQHGVQVGIEAKMTLNPKVLEQALPEYWEHDGPDYRAVLVARAGLQLHLHNIARHVGITVIRLDARQFSRDYAVDVTVSPSRLPDEMDPHLFDFRDWHSWFPMKRCTLPDYIPDVAGGKPSPVTLTQWKVRAIKLVIILDRRGYVTRADMKHLDISPTMWTAPGHGFLRTGEVRGQYVRCERTRDFRAQHPDNYAQIEADWESWKPPDEA
jgi:hypothetical protein